MRRPLVRLCWLFAAAVFLVAPSLSTAQNLTLLSHVPGRNAGNVATGAAIQLNFDRAVNTSTFTAANFRVYGRWSGAKNGAFAFSNANQTVTFTPAAAFSAGEVVVVNLSKSLRGADGTFLRNAGYAFSFTTVTANRPRVFAQLDIVAVRDEPGTGTRAYGGTASDINEDGWLDFAIVNEDSGDLRLFLNTADGTGNVGSVLLPTIDIGLGPSPNEPGDFNNDGHMDLAAAHFNIDRLSIVLGNGDATFGTPQAVTAPDRPQGLAVLDVDGDADWDAVTANASANNLALSLNNGSGVFGAMATFEAGGNGEYALAAGDMNNDGVFDLVAGTQNDSTVRVLLGNGNGTFSPGGSQAAGGAVWMIVLGDVNGDGSLDVSTANGTSANGAILLGNGNGTLQTATTRNCTGQCVATDLGDLDGDGDADWVLSSFGGGRWIVFENNSSGTMTSVEEIFATANASCAILYDNNNDGDLDLGLVDEIADEIILMSNIGGNLIFQDGFESGNTTGWSLTVP